MKVLIVNPSRFYTGQWGANGSTHLFTLYAYLRMHSPEVDVDVFDLEQELFMPETDEEVARFLGLARVALASAGFDVVGISCWTSLHYLSTLAIARLCKELNPECTVVVGGYHPTTMPDDFRFPGTPIDYLVQGEGEIAFREIVAGRVPREAKPQVVHGTGLEMETLDLPWEEYKYHRNAETVNLWLSRGCPFSCGFCLDRNTNWRGYSVARAVHEVTRLKKLLPHVKKVGFMDPIFGLNRPWRREVLDGLIAAKLDVSFWAETRADLLQDEDVQRLGALDFRMDIGVDSVSLRMIQIMMKAKHPEQYLRSFLDTTDAMTRYKVPHFAYSILNYPGETSDTLDETLGFWTRFYLERRPTYCGYAAQAFKYFPGCEVFTNFASYAERYGAKVLYPAWWKMPRSPYTRLAGHVVPSRELAEADKLHYWRQIMQSIEVSEGPAVDPKARERMMGPVQPTVEVLATGPGYYADKSLHLGADVHYHKRLMGEARLVDMETAVSHFCSREESGWVDELVGEGTTVGALGERMAARHPEQRRKLERFIANMVEQRFLAVRLPPVTGPAPSGAGRAIVRTALGDMAFELFPEEAPRTAARFLHLARAGYYDGLRVRRACPGAYVELGALLKTEPVAGEPPPAEPSGRRPQRGSLCMDLSRHEAGFTVMRGPWPELDAQGAVFGQLVEGWEVLDRIIAGDLVTSVAVQEAVVPAAGAGAQ